MKAALRVVGKIVLLYVGLTAVHGFLQNVDWDLGIRYPAPPLSLNSPEFDAIRDMNQFHSFTRRDSFPYDEALEVAACPYGFADLNGGIQLKGATSCDFHWHANVPVHGVFPYRGGLAAYTSCDPGAYGHQHNPDVGLLTFPAGIKSIADAVAPGDVFVPLGGESTLVQSRVTAFVDELSTPGNVPSVTIIVATVTPYGHSNERDAASAQELDRTVHRSMLPEDSFIWADRTATIVRIVEPDPYEYGPIGWLEVKLSDPGAARAANDPTPTRL